MFTVWSVTAPAVRVFEGGPLLCRTSAVNGSKMGQAFVIVGLINTPTVKMYLGLMSEHFHQRHDRRGLKRTRGDGGHV
jgi:hypothetical protein